MSDSITNARTWIANYGSSEVAPLPVGPEHPSIWGPELLERIEKLENTLIGQPDDPPDLWRISWLTALIVSVKEEWKFKDEDPSATAEMLDEVKALHDDAWEALKQRRESWVDPYSSPPATVAEGEVL